MIDTNAQKNKDYLDDYFKDDDPSEFNEEEMERYAQSKVDEYFNKKKVQENLSQKLDQMALDDSESQLDLRPVVQKPTEEYINQIKAELNNSNFMQELNQERGQ